MLCLKAAHTRFGENPVFWKVWAKWRPVSTALEASPSTKALPKDGCSTFYWFFSATSSSRDLEYSIRTAGRLWSWLRPLDALIREALGRCWCPGPLLRETVIIDLGEIVYFSDMFPRQHQDRGETWEFLLKDVSTAYFKSWPVRGEGWSCQN